jgi:hypothetical protein
MMLIERSVFVVERLKPKFSKYCGNQGTALQKYSLNPIAEAAIGAENPTIKDTHPLRNPNNG